MSIENDHIFFMEKNIMRVIIFVYGKGMIELCIYLFVSVIFCAIESMLISMKEVKFSSCIKLISIFL